MSDFVVVVVVVVGKSEQSYMIPPKKKKIEKYSFYLGLWTAAILIIIFPDDVTVTLCNNELQNKKPKKTTLTGHLQVT